MGKMSIQSRIWTHDLLYVNLLPQPLEQGSGPQPAFGNLY